MFFQIIIFAVPVSSSRVINTTPFAVPGRWRTSTSPATDIVAPFGGFCSSEFTIHEGGFGQIQLFLVLIMRTKIEQIFFFTISKTWSGKT
jgi:hypothetical protein